MFAGVIVLTLATPLLGSRRWFPHNLFGTFLLLFAGTLSGAMLWAGGLPPKWFDGSKVGFGISLGLMASAFGFSNADEQFYRLPWLLSFGTMLLAANILAQIQAHF